jgi:hypothetical protein
LHFRMITTGRSYGAKCKKNHFATNSPLLWSSIQKESPYYNQGVPMDLKPRSGDLSEPGRRLVTLMTGRKGKQNP